MFPFSHHTEREYCINGFLKILSISSSHTNGYPAVVPMVTALNHVVADGRRAGGLNLSSSILTDYRERESGREWSRRRCLPPRSYYFFLLDRERYRSHKKINTLGVLNPGYMDTILLGGTINQTKFKHGHDKEHWIRIHEKLRIKPYYSQ